MFGKRTAKALDTTADKANQIGRKLGSETGSRIADGLMNATLGGLRAATGQPCTRTDCTNCD
ncbi:hypothetical protein [Kitasatospora sp. NPDC085879]|uniref:hypothetical protein n=1 Tax=Kitasatospora sp. NPDC085879 TaxID=3154769 RepID=UPI00341B7520